MAGRWHSNGYCRPGDKHTSGSSCSSSSSSSSSSSRSNCRSSRSSSSSVLILLWLAVACPVLPTCKSQSSTTEFDEECRQVPMQVVTPGDYVTLATFNTSLVLSDMSVSGVVSNSCPSLFSLDQILALTCVQLMVNDSTSVGSGSGSGDMTDGRVVCFSSSTPGDVIIRVTNSGSLTPATAPGTSSDQDSDCTFLEDYLKYILIGCLAGSALLNLIFLLCIAGLCAKRRSSHRSAIAAASKKNSAPDRTTGDYVIRNRAPLTAKSLHSDDFVQAGSSDWCVTPNATLSQSTGNSVIRRSNTFDNLEAKVAKGRPPLRDVLFVHRPTPAGGVEQSTFGANIGNAEADVASSSSVSYDTAVDVGDRAKADSFASWDGPPKSEALNPRHTQYEDMELHSPSQYMNHMTEEDPFVRSPQHAVQRAKVGAASSQNSLSPPSEPQTARDNGSVASATENAYGGTLVTDIVHL